MSPDDYQRAFGAGRMPAQNAVPISTVTADSSLFEIFTGSSGTGLPALTEQTAQTVTAINACVNLISGAIAALPVDIMKRAGNGEREKLPSDDLWWILNEEFSPRWLAAAGWDYLGRSRLYHGDGFAKILRRGATVVGLMPWHPLRVQVAPWTDGSRLAYVFHPEPWQSNREPEILDQDDVLHVPGWGFDGLRSISPLRHSLRTAGGVALSTQDYAGQFFANQARPDYVLQGEGNLKPEQVTRLREQLAEQHALSRGKAGKPMVLEGGLEVKTLTFSNKDAELIASRAFQIEEIARAYGVPPFMIGHSEKTTSWGSGVEQMGAAFVRYTLRSHLNAFQNEINRKFFRSPGKCAEFDTFELERGDMKSMFEAFRIAMGRAGEPGFLSRDEVRAKIYMSRTPGGDIFNEGTSGNAQPNA